MIEELYQRYLKLAGEPGAAATLVLAHVTADKPIAEAAVTLRDAAKVLGVSYNTMSRLCIDGRIKSFKAGRSIRINRADLETYMNDAERAATPRLRCLR